MSHKVQNVSHAEHHNHLTGKDKLDTSGFGHVVSVRADNVNEWLSKGYVVISGNKGSDSYLIGKRKPKTLIEKVLGV